jgi:chromatin remodeling complex protein RSC6
MSKISNLYNTLKQNREQIKMLISQNETIQLEIEKLALDYIEENDEENDEETNYIDPNYISPFLKPYPISDDLADFLGKEKGTKMARPEANKKLVQYIKTNDLQDKEYYFKINPDNKLSTLLKLTPTDELTFFNINKYLAPHFAMSSSF